MASHPHLLAVLTRSQETFTHTPPAVCCLCRKDERQQTKAASKGCPAVFAYDAPHNAHLLSVWLCAAACCLCRKEERKRYEEALSKGCADVEQREKKLAEDAKHERDALRRVHEKQVWAEARGLGDGQRWRAGVLPVLRAFQTPRRGSQMLQPFLLCVGVE